MYETVVKRYKLLVFKVYKVYEVSKKKYSIVFFKFYLINTHNVSINMHALQYNYYYHIFIDKYSLIRGVDK